MRRCFLDSDRLTGLSKLSGIETHGCVSISASSSDRGCGIIAVKDLHGSEPVLVTVPRDLVVSTENVHIYAKADKHLQDVLDAAGKFSRVQLLPLWIAEDRYTESL